MKSTLSQNQRIVVALIYLGFLVALFKLIGGNISALIWNISVDESIWFYSAALMIILGAYIVEPFFTKPSDAIANSTAVLIALLGLTLKQDFLAYTAAFTYAVIVLGLSILYLVITSTFRIWKSAGL